MMCRRWRDYDPRRPLDRWLSGIAFKVAQRYRRSSGREVLTDVAALAREAAQLEDDEDQLLQERRRRQLMTALASLPDRHRAILVLRVVEEVPMQEVARSMSVPLFTAYNRLRRARLALAKAVKRLDVRLAIVPLGSAGPRRLAARPAGRSGRLARAGPGGAERLRNGRLPGRRRTRRHRSAAALPPAPGPPRAGHRRRARRGLGRPPGALRRQDRGAPLVGAPPPERRPPPRGPPRPPPVSDPPAGPGAPRRRARPLHTAGAALRSPTRPSPGGSSATGASTTGRAARRPATTRARGTTASCAACRPPPAGPTAPWTGRSPSTAAAGWSARASTPWPAWAASSASPSGSAASARPPGHPRPGQPPARRGRPGPLLPGLRRRPSSSSRATLFRGFLARPLPAAAGRWMHLAVVRAADATMKMFVDGVGGRAPAARPAAATAAGPAPLTIGAGINGPDGRPSEPFEGGLDEDPHPRPGALRRRDRRAGQRQATPRR